MTSNFVPKRRSVTNVTNALNAVVTTSEDHGYSTGQIVRMIVPKAYGMSLSYIQTPIEVLSPTSFQTNINTSNQLTFVTPIFPPAFTPAQVVPITGVVDNIAGES